MNSAQILVALQSLQSQISALQTQLAGAESQTSVPLKADKPKKVLSAEHLAKMKAGREAKKAAKGASSVASSVVADEASVATDPKEPKAKRQIAPEHLAKMQEALKASRAAKKALKEASEPAAESQKPKKVLSPEHLAKLKAGREAYKAKKASAQSQVPLPASPLSASAIPEVNYNVTLRSGARIGCAWDGRAWYLDAEGEPTSYAGVYDADNDNLDDSA